MNKVEKFKTQTEIVLNKLENYTHIPKKYQLHFNQSDYENIIYHIKTYFFNSIFAVIFSNTLHLLIASFFPKIYVNISSYAYIFLCFSISCIIIIFLFRANQIIAVDKLRYALNIIGFLFTVTGICLFFFIKKYNASSILLIKASTKLLGKHPLLLLLALIQSALLFIMNALFTIIITLSFTPIWPIRHIVSLVLYLAFSYYWFACTLYYVCYMTISGVIVHEFQDKNTEFSSFKSFLRVISSQFNNAAFAGLALTMNQFNMHKAAQKKPRLYKLVKNRNIFIRIVVYVFSIPGFLMSYILTFVFSIVESILKDISSNALIYCVIYNFSYKEGTMKWIRESVPERINKINQNVMIKNILFCHRIIFSLLAIFVSSLSLYIYGKNLYITDFVINIIMTIILMHSTFSIFCTLFKTTTETLFLCFSEIPDKMSEKYKLLLSELDKY